jgi:deferrochelatase/peroxidase EfeB
MTASPIDYADVQGLVRFGYKRMTEASYVLARVKDVAAARSWLGSAPVTNAATRDSPPPTALHVAFTSSGLDTFGVPAAVLAAFSPDFLGGMTEASRSRRLGDIGSNAPEHWEWGGLAATVPHLLVMFFAEPGQLAGFMQRTTGPAWDAGFETVRRLHTADLDGIEPFGFADGISQPVIDWNDTRTRSKDRGNDYSNLTAVGEFLLGYRNEYGKYTDRPVLDADTRSADLPLAEDAPEKKDLGRNGSYLVMRQLRQDVRGFWQFAYRAAGGDLAQAEALAAAFVGRTRDGVPLVPIADHPIEGIGSDPDEVRQNRFTFDDDPMGVRCPFGAHVRRANPRNADYPGRPTGLARLFAALGFGSKGFRDDLISSVRFHRILRRGREYGPSISTHDALLAAPADDPERGLHFICLNANIARQFEFLQNAWMINTKFSALTGESDPLLGTREPRPGCPVTDAFVLQNDGRVRTHVSALPQFVTVRGGAYFFLPGLRALSYIAKAHG